MPETKLAVIVETSVKESANRLLLQYMKRYFAAESEMKHPGYQCLISQNQKLH